MSTRTVRLPKGIKNLLKFLAETYIRVANAKEVRDFTYECLNTLSQKAQIETTVITYDKIENVLKSLGIYCSFVDGRYRVFKSIEYMKKIISLDWSNFEKYETEYNDCDDFAWHFKSHLDEIWKINGVGWAVGVVYDASSGQELGGHAYNIIVESPDGQNVKLFVYEPQADIYTELTSKRVRLGSWDYETYFVLF